MAFTSRTELTQRVLAGVATIFFPDIFEMSWAPKGELDESEVRWLGWGLIVVPVVLWLI